MRSLFVIAVIAVFVLLFTGWIWMFDYTMLRPERRPDALRIRCEDGLGGVLIDGACFKRDALHWSAEEAPK